MLVPRRFTSSLVAPERMATAKALTASCVTSCSMAKSSTVSRKQRLSSSNGATTTTPSDRTRLWAIDRPHHKHSGRSCIPWIRSRRCNKLSIPPVQKSLQARRNFQPLIANPIPVSMFPSDLVCAPSGTIIGCTSGVRCHHEQNCFKCPGSAEYEDPKHR